MIKEWINWRTILVIVAICIVGSTIFYSNYLEQKIAKEERQKIEQWAEAIKNNSNPNITETTLTGKVLAENSLDIPILLVTENVWGAFVDSINLFYYIYNPLTFKYFFK